jgi:hypothetical protein
MFLKTTCEGCIFREADTCGCEIGKPVLLEEKRQITYGLCGHRRTSDWATKLVTSDLAYSPERSFEYADAENRTLSVMVVAQTPDADDLFKTLSSIHDDTGILKEVICVTNSAQPDQSKAMIKLLSDSEWNWKFENLQNWEEFNKEFVVDYSSRRVGSTWFLPIHSGNTLSAKTIETIYDTLVDVRSNPIAFIMNDFSVVTPIYAFEAMGGNTEKPWIEKVKEFDNWKEVCIGIR